MGHFLANFYTLPCAICLLAGFFGRLAYCRQKAKQLDKIAPNLDGSKHDPGTFNRLWVGVFAGLLVFGYLVMKAQQTEDHAIETKAETVQFKAQLRACVVEFQGALKVRSDMAAKDAELSNAISDLRSDLDNAQGNFLKQRLSPPANIVGLPETDPRRVQWKDDITASFANWQANIRAKIADKVTDRKKLAADRAANPLPDLTC